jgi:hypothetical protein
MGGGGSHWPLRQAAPPGHTASVHASLQLPIRHTKPVSQVLFSQPSSTQRPLAAQVLPIGQMWQPQLATHTPFSHTAPGQLTPAHRSRHAPSTQS